MPTSSSSNRSVWTSKPTQRSRPKPKENDFDNFTFGFDRKFLSALLARADTNDEIFKKMLDDDAFQKAVKAHYARTVYDNLRDAS